MSKNYLYVNGQSISVGENNCTFNASRTEPMLEKLDSYVFSIIRASLDGMKLPVFIPKMNYNSANPNDTAYKIVVKAVINGQTYYNSEASQTIQFSNNYGVVSPSVVPVSQQLVCINPYYWTYDLFDVLEMFNNAINNVWTDIKNQIEGYTVLTLPPKLTVNGNLFSMMFDKRGFTNELGEVGTSTTEAFYISFNDDLRNIFRTFQYRYNFNVDAQLLSNIILLNNAFSETTYNSISYIVASQSYPSMSILSPVENIVFFSQNGDYKSEINNYPNVLNSSNPFVSMSSAIENQITDIDLDAENPMDYSNVVIYDPKTLREINITNTSMLQNINIVVKWRNRFGDIFDVVMRDGSSMNIKLKYSK